MQRILVVEDDFDIQELLQNFLQEAGYEVAVANDGVEALSLFAGQRYDLIVLDIMLPKIDGYGVCELIRKQSDVPIIMLHGRLSDCVPHDAFGYYGSGTDYVQNSAHCR